MRGIDHHLATLPPRAHTAARRRRNTAPQRSHLEDIAPLPELDRADMRAEELSAVHEVLQSARMHGVREGPLRCISVRCRDAEQRSNEANGGLANDVGEFVDLCDAAAGSATTAATTTSSAGRGSKVPSLADVEAKLVGGVERGCFLMLLRGEWQRGKWGVRDVRGSESNCKL